MHLGDCRRNNPGTGRWFFQDGRVAGSRDMDRQLDLVDDTLNSWKEAHNAFDRHQGDEPVITNAAFMQMRSLVHKVRKSQYGHGANIETAWPTESITWALLTRWIEVRQAQLKIDTKAQAAN